MDFQKSEEMIKTLLRPYCEWESTRRDFFTSALGEKHPALNLITFAGRYEDFVRHLTQQWAHHAFEGVIQVLTHAQHLQSDGELPTAFSEFIAELGETKKEVDKAIKSNIATFSALSNMHISDEEVTRFQEEQMGGTGNRLEQAALFIGLGKAKLEQGDTDNAMRQLRPALEICRETGERALEAETLEELAKAKLQLREPRAALEQFQRALPIYQELGDKFNEARLLGGCGLAVLQAGDAQAAMTYYERAANLFSALGEKQEEASSLSSLRDIAMKMPYSPEVIVGVVERVIPLYVELGEIFAEASARGVYAVCLHDTGKKSEAIAELERGIQAFKRLQTIQDTAEVRWFLAKYNKDLAVWRWGISGRALSILQRR